MKSFLLWGIFISSICFPISSCDVCSCKVVPCSAFNDANFLEWFSYQENQQIIFHNQSSFYTISIVRISKSNMYDAEKGCQTGDDGCNSSCNITGNEGFGSNIKVMQIDYFSETPFGSPVSTKNIYFKFLGAEVPATDITNQGLTVSGGYSGSFSSYVNIGGYPFYNVQVITKNTPTGTAIKPEPYKIYLGRGQGLVGYEMYPTNELWIKQ